MFNFLTRSRSLTIRQDCVWHLKTDKRNRVRFKSVCVDSSNPSALSLSLSLSLSLCGTTYLWQSDLVTHSAPSNENFVHTLKQLHRMYCDRILLESERERETERETDRQTDGQTQTERHRQTDRQTDRLWGFRVIAIAVTGHLRPTLYTHILRPVLPTACESQWPTPTPPPPTPYCSL